MENSVFRAESTLKLNRRRQKETIEGQATSLMERRSCCGIALAMKEATGRGIRHGGAKQALAEIWVKDGRKKENIEG